MTYHPDSDYLTMYCDVPKEQSSVTLLLKSQVSHDGYYFSFGNSVFRYSLFIADC